MNETQPQKAQAETIEIIAMAAADELWERLKAQTEWSPGGWPSREETLTTR